MFHKVTFKSSLFLIAALALCFGCSNPNFTGDWDVAIDPDLPNVLIIGDSISGGYIQDVRQLLEGRTNVLRPMEKVKKGLKKVTYRDTRFGLVNLEKWLGDLKWEVIHFNWGLHDLCYRTPIVNNQSSRDKINGKISVSLADYQDNLEELVVRLKSTEAVLIWASTTFVPEGEVGRFAGDELKYNDKAREVMAKHGIAINDLHALTSNFDITLFRKPGNVHYTKEGYQKLAAQVAEQIEQALEN